MKTKQQRIKKFIKIGVYFYIDRNKRIFDEEEMIRELEYEIKYLKQKYTKVK